MNYLFKNGRLRLAVCFLSCYLILSACSSSLHGQKGIKIEKYVSWQIKFKEGTTAQQKSQALVAVDRYILDYIEKQQYPTIMRQASFSQISPGGVNLPGANLTVSVGFDPGDISTGASPTPHVGPRPPKDEALVGISPFIQSINDIGGSEFNR